MLVLYDPDREWPFLARDAELTVLNETILSDASGPTPGAVVFGAAGVGKTRLVRECADRASARGVPVRYITGTWTTRHTPYVAVAHLAPDVIAAAHADPLALYRDVADALHQHQHQHQHPLLVVNDAHLLDDGSAALLLHLALADVATLLVTVRRGAEVPDPISVLWKDALAVRVDLQGLAQHEVEELISVALGGAVARSTLHRLARTASGNVLYARELVRSAYETGSLRVSDGLWSWDGNVVVGDRLVDAVGRRLAGLGEGDREALARVAVGQPLRLDLAELAVGSAALRRLETVRLITVHDDICRLEHPLFGEVLLADRGVLAARSDLRALADAADAVGDRDEQDLLRRIIWRVESGGIAPAAETIQAARLALTAFDAVHTEKLAAAALRVDPSACDARVVLARALSAQGRFAAAADHLADVEASVLDDGSAAVRREWLDASVVALHQGLGRTAQAQELLERVESSASALPADRRLARAMHGNLLVDEDRLRDAVDVTSAVLEESDAADYAAVIAASSLGEAQANLGLTLSARTTHALLRALQDAGVPEARRAGDYAVLQEVMCLLFEGWADRAATLAEGMYRALVERREHTTVGLGAFVLGKIRLSQGRLRDARKALQEAIELLRRTDLDGALPWGLSVLAQIEALLGDVGAARAALEESRLLHREPVPGRARMDLVMAEVRIRAVEGDLTGAARTALEAVEETSPDGVSEFVVNRARLLLVAARLGNSFRASIADRLTALAAAAECDLVEHQARYARAIAVNDPAALSAMIDLYDDRGLRLDALTAASDSARLFAEMGDAAASKRMQARAARLAAECGSPLGLRAAPVAARSPLSPREMEIATLAADGLTNAEIAARLVLSVRTIESHLYQAFGKLGVQDRTQLRSVLQNQ